jgi:hypothetical protein
MFLVACTSLNKVTFAIDPQAQIPADEVLRGVEEPFQASVSNSSERLIFFTRRRERRPPTS